MKNLVLNSNGLALARIWISGVAALLLFASCSKPAPEESKTENATPSPVEQPTPVTAAPAPMKKQAQNPVPMPSPSPVTAFTSEEIAAYAAAMGVDPDTAKTMLKEEAAFWFDVNEAIASSNAQKLSDLVSPHFDKLKRTLTTGGNYQPDPNGKLPQWWEAASASEGIATLSTRINQPGYLELAPAYLVDQRMTYGSMSNAAKSRPELLQNVLAMRVDDAPSPLDVIVYQGILDGLAENVSSQRADSGTSNEDYPGGDLVRQLGTAKNPIYRLFAVEQATRINDADRLSFYETFIAEKDPRIKGRAIEGVAQMPSPEAINVLRRFEQNALQQGDRENADLASQALKRLQGR